MQETPALLLVVLTTLLFPYLGESACCFGFRKVCESISDVRTHGNNEWSSLIVMPGRCENSSRDTHLEIITEDTFANTPQLTNVYIVDKTVNFTKNCFKPLENNLGYLSIIQNNISVVPVGVFENLPKLKKLVLRDSRIEEIPEEAFKHLPKLEVLLFSGNKLQEVKSGILNSVEAKTIDLSFNSITKIEQNAFPNTLILLNLKKNSLKEISDNTFSNLNSLEMLILSKNKLKVIRKGIFNGLNNLSKLDLSRNEIETIGEDTFSDLHELMFLYLKHNRLQVLNVNIFLKDMINLTDLELEQNQLSYLSEKIFDRMPNLEEISLSGNPWQCKCLEDIFEIMGNRSISTSDTDDMKPKCTLRHDICVPVN